MIRIGLFGGTFDPPHLGHLVLAASAQRVLTLDRLLFVPAGDPWRKAGNSVSSAAERLGLTRLAVGETLPWVEVSAVEVSRAGPSYTVETLNQLQNEIPDAEWWVILGYDALADMPNWHEPEQIINQARLALAQRGDIKQTLPAVALEAIPDLEAHVDFIPMPRIDVSASELRRRIREGEDTESLLPMAVRQRITEKGLYLR